MLQTALAKQVEDRFASAGAFLGAVEEVAALLVPAQPLLPEAVVEIAPAAERTLLALPRHGSDRGQKTLLHPRLVRRAAARRAASQRWWWGGGLAAVVALLLLLVWLGHRSPHTAQSGHPSETVAKTAVVEPLSPPRDEPAAVSAGTALQTVENVRVQKRVESPAVTERAVAAPAAADWQVVENHSRKLR